MIEVQVRAVKTVRGRGLLPKLPGLRPPEKLRRPPPRSGGVGDGAPIPASVMPPYELAYRRSKASIHSRASLCASARSWGVILAAIISRKSANAF